MWTLQSAIQQSVVISTINAAVEARVISSRKDERVAASKILPQPKPKKFKGDRAKLVDAVRNALYASKIVSYAQGMELLGAASKQYKWNLNFGDIATIWRGGCIIRAKFLNRIVEAYQRDPALHNLLLDSYFTDIIAKTQDNWRVAVSTAVEHGVAVPGVRRVARLFRQLSLRRVCLRICCKRNATSSARIPTNASISPASFTPNGWSPITNRWRKRPSQRNQRAVTPANSCSVALDGECGAKRLTVSVKIVRLAPDELLVRERFDLARFD